MTDLYVKKVAEGNGSGSDWANAKGYVDSATLRDDLEDLRAGDTLYFGNDFGKRDYIIADLLMLVNAVNGDVDNPITFCGSVVTNTVEEHSSSKGKTPVFHGGVEHPLVSGDDDGIQFLRIERDHYKILGINLVNAEFLLTIRNRPVTGITVSDCEVYNTQLVFSCGASDSDVTDLTVNNVVAGNVTGGFGLFRNGSNLKFRDVHISHSDETTDIFGFKFGASNDLASVVDDIEICDSTFNGGYNFNGSPAYIQGDGIIAEIGTSNILVCNVLIRSYGDAGIDLKSNGALIQHADIQDCKYGIKIWGLGSNDIEDSSVSGCSLGAVQCIGDITAKRCTFKGYADSKCTINMTKNSANNDKLGEMYLEDCVLDHDDASKMIYGYAGNRIHLKDCIVNGVAIKETKFELPSQGNHAIVDGLTDF